MRVYVVTKQVGKFCRVEAIYFDEAEAHRVCAEKNVDSDLDEDWYVEDHDVRGYRRN